MRALLDTHIFLWAITQDKQLSKRYRAFYLDDANELLFSVASIWEILIKCGTGKLPMPKPTVPYLTKHLERNRVRVLGIQIHHLAELERLPPLHKDPFDRIIAAQGRADKLKVLSADPKLAGYGVDLL